MNSKRVKTKAWLLVAAVFLLGSATGGALAGIYLSRAAGPLTTPSIRDGEIYLQALDRELSLDANQAEIVSGIIEDTRGRFTAICAEVRPRYDALREEARKRIRAVLAEQQRRRFDALVSQEDCNCPDQKK
jgi:hypothetical protein